MKCIIALLRRLLETGTDSIKYTEWFKLSTVSLLINDNWREDICSIISPILNLFINNRIRRASCLPFSTWERVINTFLSLKWINFREILSPPRTVLIDGWHTYKSNSLDILPELLSFVFVLCILPNTLLSKIFEHNFVTFDGKITWLYSAILSTTVAIRFQVVWIASFTLPEHKVRSNLCLVS